MKILLAAALAALALPAAAFAHAKVSPPDAMKGESQVFTLADGTVFSNAACAHAEPGSAKAASRTRSSARFTAPSG